MDTNQIEKELDKLDKMLKKYQMMQFFAAYGSAIIATIGIYLKRPEIAFIWGFTALSCLGHYFLYALTDRLMSLKYPRLR